MVAWVFRHDTVPNGRNGHISTLWRGQGSFDKIRQSHGRWQKSAVGDARTRRTTALPEVQLWHWLAFGLLVALLLTLDLSMFHRRDRVPSLGESALVTAVWCTLAAAFGGLTWWWRGSEAGVQFLTGYLVEWSLSMDNVFVFAVIFRFFRRSHEVTIPRAVLGHHRGRLPARGIHRRSARGVEPIRLDPVASRTFLDLRGHKLAWQRADEIDPQPEPLVAAGQAIFSRHRGDQIMAAGSSLRRTGASRHAAISRVAGDREQRPLICRR